MHARSKSRRLVFVSRPVGRGAVRGDGVVAAVERLARAAAVVVREHLARVVAGARGEGGLVRVARLRDRGLGRKRVIQVRFNMSVPRARVPEKASMLRDRSER
jgi:hypothetical protein